MLLENELIVRPRNKSGKEGRGHHQDDLLRPSDRPSETSGCDENNAQNLHFSNSFASIFFGRWLFFVSLVFLVVVITVSN